MVMQQQLLQHKSAGLTLLFNFLLPGTGHLYASSGHQGMRLLVINLICGISGAFLIVPLLGVLVLWIYTMATSAEIARAYNAERERAFQAGKEKLDVVETTRVRDSARLDAERSSFVSGQTVTQSIAKLGALVAAGIMDESEATSEKRRIIQKALEGWTDEELADFLTPFTGIVSDGILTRDEMLAIKRMYGAIHRTQRP